MTDNSLAKAQPLGILDNNSVVRRNALSGRDRVDYFKFSLGKSGSANFKLSGLRSNADLALLDGTGKVIARSNKGGNKPEKLQRQLAAGEYYIQVKGNGGSTKYKLKSSAVVSGGSTGPGTDPIQPPPPPRNRLVASGNLLGQRGSRLGSVDLSTGVLTLLPTSGAESILPWDDIAVFGNEGYFLTLNSLNKIDPTTGVTSDFPSNRFNNQVIATLGFTTSGELYATSGSRFVSVSRNEYVGGFYKVDIANEKVNLVAEIPGFNGVGDIAYDPGSGRFFATSRNPLDGFDQLFSIGLSGDATLIGNMGYQGVGGLIVDSGILYGFAGNEQLVINTTTGVATLDKKLTIPNETFIPGIGGGA
jgi:Bacterial pre-peptidase C-terminal domain